MLEFVKSHYDALRDGLAVVAVVWLTWLVARHGVTWVWSKASSIWSSIKADTSGLVARVEALETDVAGLHTATGTPATAPKVKAKTATGTTGVSGPTGATGA